MCAVEQVRVYLLDRPFRLRTDHRALQWLLSKEPTASARVSRWIASLMEYPIAVKYIKGTENTIADILSRISGHAVDQLPPAELANGVASYVFTVSNADRLEVGTHWLREQRADATISRIVRGIEDNTKPDANEIQLDPILQNYIDV